MKSFVKSHKGNAFAKTKQKPQFQIQPLKKYLPSNYLSCKKEDIRKYTFIGSFVQKKYRQDNPKSNEIGCVQVVGTGRNKVGNEDRVVGMIAFCTAMSLRTAVMFHILKK